jgi:HD-GYP domain-containing protein (c-di-GMP phosphodiesterase class II)
MEHVPFRVSTLRGDQKVSFNAYVKINEKMILYIRQGDSFEGTRLQRLKEKKLKLLYIKREEEPNYLTYLEKNNEIAYNKNSGKSIESRGEIIQGFQQSQIEEVFENASNVQIYNQAKSNADKFVHFILNENDALKALIAIDNVDKNIAHHSVTVASVATALSKEMGITDKKDLQNIVMGALLHDYHHYHSGLNVSRPLSEFNPKELTTYKEHPTLGVDALKDKKHIDPQVLAIVLQHEEFINGNGFPQGLMEKKINPFAIIVGVANAYDRLVSFEGVAKNAAAKKLMIDKVGKYPLTHLQKLNALSANFATT